MARVTLRINGAGLQTTIQDLGRPAFQHAAIPGGGAMDRIACRVANLLVGNDDGDAVLEAALIGPSIEFESSSVFAIGGGDLGAVVGQAPIPVFHPVFAPAGSVLRFGAPKNGCRAYIAIAGGIDVPRVFGSRATYLRAAFGGLDGRALRTGDRIGTGVPSRLSNVIRHSLESEKLRIARWSIGATIRPHYGSDVVVRVIDGAHSALLDGPSRERFFSERFRVSSSSDRMGYRLEGPTITLGAPTELLSEAVTFGTIQLPPGGTPIILMADRQTTGGYPRIGEVATVDLPLVAQLKPGDTLRFRGISLNEAQQLHLALEAELAQARAGIRLRFPTGKDA